MDRRWIRRLTMLALICASCGTDKRAAPEQAKSEQLERQADEQPDRRVELVTSCDRGDEKACERANIKAVKKLGLRALDPPTEVIVCVEEAELRGVEGELWLDLQLATAGTVIEVERVIGPTDAQLLACLQSALVGQTAKPLPDGEGHAFLELELESLIRPRKIDPMRGGSGAGSNGVGAMGMPSAPERTSEELAYAISTLGNACDVLDLEHCAYVSGETLRRRAKSTPPASPARITEVLHGSRPPRDEAEVQLVLCVDGKGRVGRRHVRVGPSQPIIDLALETVEDWTFEPLIVDSQVYELCATWVFEFES